MYPNEGNFYSMGEIEELAQKILAVGLLENMTVTYCPCEKGNYKIIAGERRWRALNLLVSQGYEEFDLVTCQVKPSAEESEEKLVAGEEVTHKEIKRANSDFEDRLKLTKMFEEEEI